MTADCPGVTADNGSRKRTMRPPSFPVSTLQAASGLADLILTLTWPCGGLPRDQIGSERMSPVREVFL